MADDWVRLGWLQRAARILFYIAALCGLVLIVFGLYLGLARSMTGVAIAMVASGAGAILIFALAFGIVVAMVHTHTELHRTRRGLLTLIDLQQSHFEQERKHLETIAENVQLSDAAKALSHREKERETLRAAIREDITREDWEAAFSLVDQMTIRFGYREEAERFREEIEQSRQDAIESKVNLAIQQAEDLFAAHQWDRARDEVRRLLSLYPDHPRIAVLPDRLENSFAERKELLKKQFREAAERKEVNRSIELIKELDTYLAPGEAKELTDTVREVFRDKLDNLTVEFELAVQEQKWMEAVDVAKQIMTEYPNTRRAQELRDGVFESLLKRAGLTANTTKAT